MADPVSLGIGALVVGGGLSAYSQIRNGYGQAQQLQSQSDAANINAQIARQKAQQGSAQAVSQSNQQNDKAQQQIGSQIAQTSESGIGFTGTGGDLLQQSETNAELDRQNILYNGLLQNQATNYQADQDQYQANVYASQEGNAITGGYLGAIGGLLNSAGQYSALKTYKYNPSVNQNISKT